MLLVDDDAQLRQIACAMLEDLGCEVLAADGADQALALLRGAPEVSVAIVDYAMPGVSGVDLARQIGEVAPGLPVVLSSGYMDADESVRSWSGPILPKPYSYEELTRLLSRYAVSRSEPAPEGAD